MNIDIDLFTELFPIRVETLPQITAYQIESSGRDVWTLGGKLSYRMRKSFGGHWVWSRDRLLTDAPQDGAVMRDVIERLWREHPDIFRDLRAIHLDSSWSPHATAQADFTAKGLFADVEKAVRGELKSDVADLGNAKVERHYEVRGWVVQGAPSVSLSVFSRLIYKHDLRTYSEQIKNMDDLVGLWVADKTSSLKGEIIEIVGTMKEHRKRLMILTQREEMLDIIERSSDDEIVVRVQANRQAYDYPSSALGIVLTMENMARFDVNRRHALKTLKMEPRFRARLIKKISALAKENNLISKAYNSKSFPSHFKDAANIGFKPRIAFGNAQADFDEKSLLTNLHKHGLYKQASQFSESRPLRVGVISALRNQSSDSFLKTLTTEFGRLRFAVSEIGRELVGKPTRQELEIGIQRLLKHNPDIVLAFFPDEETEDDDSYDAYFHLKSLTVNRDIASQVVFESTLDKRFAVGNILLGMLAKVGNIPFILAEPLEYADLVVGIDIARERKKKLAGSINATAIARIYFGNGEFLRYAIHDTPLEGETIPEAVLQALFPMDEFRGKRVVVHRDGYFRGDEKRVLKSWAQEIDATFHLVEIIKTGTPRLYGIQNTSIVQPPKATAFIVNEHEAFLVSSLPPFKDATPQPLHVKADFEFPIEKAVHSVLALTVLHYGSLRPPRLPVTIHYSDQIAYLALRGIKPRSLVGNIPFWL